MTQTLGTTYNPFADDPYPLYTRARREEPVFYMPDKNVWVVTRYEDVQSILLQPEKFSSRDTLSTSFTVYPRARQELAKGFMPIPNVINSDGSNHTRFRVPLAKAFSPARAKTLEPYVQELVNELVDSFIDEKRVEIVGQFAYPLTSEVILKHIGIPKKDMRLVDKLGTEWLELLSVQCDEERQTECAKSCVALQHYLTVLLAERRQHPQEDVISMLATITAEGEEPLSTSEVVQMVQGLIIAHRNATNMIGSGVLLLLERPKERWKFLRAYPERIPQVIEEIVRYDSPFDMVMRTTNQEVTLGGVTISANSRLWISYESANRDEKIFEHANEFQVQRSSNPHLGFGHGMHYCIGAAVVRVVGRIAFEVLTQRLPQPRLVPNQVLTQPATSLFRGYERVEVQW